MDPVAKHHKNHSIWYNKVDKLVLSRSMAGQKIPKVTIIGDAAPSVTSILPFSCG